jgi:peptidyl-prolyl cis-trans isomerase A (cyclophilin A)
VSPKTSSAPRALPGVLALALAPVTFAALAACQGCQASPAEPGPDKTPAAQPTGNKASTDRKAGDGDGQKAQTPEPPRAPVKRKVSARPTASVEPSAGDPLHGKFTLDDATKGLPAGKQLVATIETSLGKLECNLFDDKAPITVANFVGLARGIRPWKTPGGTWEKKPAYDGTIFHRIIKGFMIQGGDALKNGTGEPGYVIPDEVWEDAVHDRAGLLCMANRGKNTNGAQFFITDAAAAHLDNGYTIFGECSPEALVHQIASVPVSRERPETPVDIKKITITRK